MVMFILLSSCWGICGVCGIQLVVLSWACGVVVLDGVDIMVFILGYGVGGVHPGKSGVDLGCSLSLWCL